jgi:hypothetical protein
MLICSLLYNRLVGHSVVSPVLNRVIAPRLHSRLHPTCFCLLTLTASVPGIVVLDNVLRTDHNGCFITNKILFILVG